MCAEVVVGERIMGESFMAPATVHIEYPSSGKFSKTIAGTG
jgi:hypothetical protein